MAEMIYKEVKKNVEMYYAYGLKDPVLLRCQFSSN